MCHLCNCGCDASLRMFVCLETGYIGQSQYRDIECVTEFYESGCFSCSSCSQDCFKLFCFFTVCTVNFRTVCYSSDGCSVQFQETGYHLFCIVRFCLNKILVICDVGKKDCRIACCICKICTYTVQIIAAVIHCIFFVVCRKQRYQFADT